MEEAVKSTTILIDATFLSLAALLLLSGCEGGAKVQNNAPSEITLTQERSFIWTGGRVKLVASATDEDGDPLTFTWKATKGTFDPASATGTTVYWIAPGAPGSARITMSVTDDITTVARAVDVAVCIPFPEDIVTMTVRNQGYYYILEKASAVDIPIGSELTIEPGVVVVVDSKFGGLAVDGSLVANGTSSRHIRFMGNTTVGGTGLWDGISASGPAASIYFKNVEVSNGDAGVVAMNGAVMTLDSCTIFDNGSTGVWASDRASLTMRGCAILTNVSGVYVRSSEADISRCRIEDSESNGLEMSAGLDSSSMLVDSSVIANNGGNQVVLTNQARPEIHYCSIFDVAPAQGSYSMKLDSYIAVDSVHAERNYWGVGFDANKIKSVICDKGKLNCASAAYVRFAPWLMSAPVMAGER